MEKKGGRLLQSCARGLATSDAKKNQDGANCKLVARGGRRREPNGGSLSFKNGELSRHKSTPQQQQRGNKFGFDKKSKPRGSPLSSTTSTTSNRIERTGLDDQNDDFEVGSVFLPGSKKQSLNHLLNFTYVPYQPTTTRTDSGRYQSTKNNSSNRLINTKKHKYNKEHFLQANCQFIVNPSGDYKQYMNNPDALVDWKLIEQVNLQVSEFPCCPICLYPPIAAKITRCGHIYCWSCLLHYLALSDKDRRPCPICYESVLQTDLKSVVSIPHNTFNVNDTITFKLMKRPRGSLIAYSATSIINKDDAIFHLSDIKTCDVYSKLLIANLNEILSIIDRERDELNKQKSQDENCPESCFIDEALKLLKIRREDVLEYYNKNEQSNYVHNKNNGNDEDDNTENKATGEHGETFSFENLDISSNSEQALPKFHYFYQASDGQHIYLHAINARMLEHTYGALENSPKTISGKILEKEGGSMDETLRKRLRYLQHLPLTCQFEVAEIQLNEPIISKETFEHFKEQLEIRQKRRQRRAKDEKRREKRIAAEQNRLMGKYPIPNLHIESESQFPCFEASTSRIRTESESTQPSDTNTISDVITPSGSLTKDQEYSGPSFATVIASAKKSNKIPPLPSSSSSSPAPSVRMINVTGAKVFSHFTVRHHDDDDDDEAQSEILGAVPPPCNRNLADVIAQALKKNETTDDCMNNEVFDGKKKKKKKNKQKVLFANSMAYSTK